MPDLEPHHSRSPTREREPARDPYDKNIRYLKPLRAEQKKQPMPSRQRERSRSRSSRTTTRAPAVIDTSDPKFRNILERMHNQASDSPLASAVGNLPQPPIHPQTSPYISPEATNVPAMPRESPSVSPDVAKVLPSRSTSVESWYSRSASVESSYSSAAPAHPWGSNAHESISSELVESGRYTGTTQSTTSYYSTTEAVVKTKSKHVPSIESVGVRVFVPVPVSITEGVPHLPFLIQDDGLIVAWPGPTKKPDFLKPYGALYLRAIKFSSTHHLAVTSIKQLHSVLSVITSEKFKNETHVECQFRERPRSFLQRQKAYKQAAVSTAELLEAAFGTNLLPTSSFDRFERNVSESATARRAKRDATAKFGNVKFELESAKDVLPALAALSDAIVVQASRDHIFTTLGDSFKTCFPIVFDARNTVVSIDNSRNFLDPSVADSLIGYTITHVAEK